MKHWVEGVLEWLGEEIDGHRLEKLSRYSDWLREEAAPAGGIGPGEGDRVVERHVADSLAFGVGFSPGQQEILDIGSGVGLPGIPLAILRCRSSLVLLDRSGRRCDLAERAVRILGLDNVVVSHGSAEDWKDRRDVLVMRAALPPTEAFPLVERLLRPTGVAVLGLSRETMRPPVATLESKAGEYGLAVEVIPVPVLDSPTSLLRIVRNDDIL